jgi:hypothetical protein
MTKVAGFGSESGSINQMHGSAERIRKQFSVCVDVPKNCLRLFSDEFWTQDILEDKDSSHGKPAPIPKEKKLISCIWM